MARRKKSKAKSSAKLRRRKARSAAAVAVKETRKRRKSRAKSRAKASTAVKAAARKHRKKSRAKAKAAAPVKARRKKSRAKAAVKAVKAKAVKARRRKSRAKAAAAPVKAYRKSAARKRRRKSSAAAVAAPVKAHRKSSGKARKRSRGKARKHSMALAKKSSRSYAKKRHSRERYALENPLSGTELAVGALTLTLGYGVADVLDRFLATHALVELSNADGRPSGRLVDQGAKDGGYKGMVNGTAVLAPLDMKRAVAGGLLAALPLAGAHFVKSDVGRSALQFFGFGVGIRVVGKALVDGVAYLSRKSAFGQRLYNYEIVASAAKRQDLTTISELPAYGKRTEVRGLVVPGYEVQASGGLGALPQGLAGCRPLRFATQEVVSTPPPPPLSAVAPPPPPAPVVPLAPPAPLTPSVPVMPPRMVTPIVPSAPAATVEPPPPPPPPAPMLPAAQEASTSSGGTPARGSEASTEGSATPARPSAAAPEETRPREPRRIPEQSPEGELFGTPMLVRGTGAGRPVTKSRFNWGYQENE